MSDKELFKLRTKLGIRDVDERMILDTFIDILKKNDVDDFLIGEITDHGYGSDLVAQHKQFKDIDVN